MGDLGLLLGLGIDDTQAKMDLGNFGESLNRTFEDAARDTKPLNDALDKTRKSLLNQHQIVHLLAEELGIHLPRAVVIGLSEMLPPIQNVGSALLAVFAAEELIKFGKELHHLADEFNEVAESQKILNEAGRENASILEDQAKKSLSYARSQATLLQVQAAAAEAAVDQRRKDEDELPQWEKVIAQASLAVSTLGWSLLFTKQSNEALGVAQRFYLGTSKDLTDAIKEQTRLDELRDKVVKILGQDEEEGGKKAKNAAREAAAARRKAAEEERKDNEYLAAALEKWAKEDDTRLKAAVRAELEAINQRTRAHKEFTTALNQENAALDASLAKMPTVALSTVLGTMQMTSATNQLSASRKALIGITEELHRVESLFTHAMHGEVDGLINATQRIGDLGGEFAGLIGGTKAAAYVRGGFDVALALENAAKFVASWGTDVAAGEAAAQYGLAAAEMFKVAGRGSAGASSGRGSYGGSARFGEDRGGGSGYGMPPQTLAPGAAGGGSRYGGSLHVIVVGEHQAGEWLAGTLNAAVNRGVNLTATASQRGAPVGH